MSYMLAFTYILAFEYISFIRLVYLDSIRQLLKVKILDPSLLGAYFYWNFSYWGAFDQYSNTARRLDAGERWRKDTFWVLGRTWFFPEVEVKRESRLAWQGHVSEVNLLLTRIVNDCLLATAQTEYLQGIYFTEVIHICVRLNFQDIRLA